MGGLTPQSPRRFAAQYLSPSNGAEHAFGALSRLPGTLGHIGYRKLKRRLQHRAEDRFQALAQDLGPSGIALDLGANIGDMTAKLAANGATVHAYEPEPDTFALLAERFAGQAHVHLNNAAVADFDGEADLILPASFSSSPRSASKAASIAHDRYRTDGHQSRTIKVRDIRRILADLPQAPSLIKMDIEGAELDVLDALRAEGLLTPKTALFVETHERMDPSTLPRIAGLQAWARAECPSYLNLYWG